MRRGSALGVLILALAIVALAAGLAAWREGRRPAFAEPSLPRVGLRITLSSSDLQSRFRDLARRPVWRGLVAGRAPFRSSLPGSGPAGLGLYDQGWIAVVPSSFDVPTDRPSLATGPWRLVASSPALLDAPPEGSVRLDLPPDSLAATITPAAWVAGRAPGWIGDLEPRFPTQVVGRIIRDPSGPRESWEIRCEGPCALDLLDANGSADESSGGWAALPESVRAIAWVEVSPERLAASLPRERLDALEGLLGTPARAELASVLSGTGLLALLDEPSPSEFPRILAAADLAQPTRARELLERVLALGVLTRSMDIGRYRGAWIGAWGDGSWGGAQPAIAVDGSLLLIATRVADIRDAIDRRRRPRPETPLRSRISALGPGSWKAWSRSPFVATSWEEILTRRPVTSAGAPSEVTAVIGRSREGVWRLESRGEPPAFAADPLVPIVRSMLRAWERAGARRSDQRSEADASSRTRTTYARVSR